MTRDELEAIRARDADDYAAADVLRNIRSAGNTDPELEATINMIADRRDLLALVDEKDNEITALRMELQRITGRLLESERRRAELAEAAGRVTCRRCGGLGSLAGLSETSHIINHAPCPDCTPLRELLRDAQNYAIDASDRPGATNAYKQAAKDCWERIDAALESKS